MSGRAPSLLCLNLRREHVHDIEDVGVAAALQRVTHALAEARLHGWRVLHAFTTQPRGLDRGYGALPGFEPAAQEPVFALLSTSALSEPQIEDAMHDDLRVVGGVYSRCGLATALAAQERCGRITIVREACFAPSIHAVHARAVLEAAGAQEQDLWGNVICLEKRRS